MLKMRERFPINVNGNDEHWEKLINEYKENEVASFPV